jgi:hypothetical protein
MELMVMDIAETMKAKGVYNFVASPGIVVSGITQGVVSAGLLFYFMIIVSILHITPQSSSLI